MFLVYPACCLCQMLFGLSDGSLCIDRISKFRTDVGVRHCHSMVSQHAGICQGIHPVHPVLTAHNFDGSLQLLLICRLYCLGHNCIVSQIQALLRESTCCRLQSGGPCFVVRSRPSRCRQAVDHHVHLSQVRPDHVNCLLFYFR